MYRIGFDLTVNTLSRDSILSFNNIYKNYQDSKNYNISCHLENYILNIW